MNVVIIDLGYVLKVIINFLKELEKWELYGELWKEIDYWEVMKRRLKWLEDYLDFLKKSFL